MTPRGVSCPRQSPQLRGTAAFLAVNPSDCAYGRPAFSAMGDSGKIRSEGLISADEKGLARLFLKLGTDPKAPVEMISGAGWIRDRLGEARR
jgi:hypothetical protein